MTKPRQTNKDPLLQIQDEILELIAKTFGRNYSDEIYFTDDNAFAGRLYNKLRRLEPSLENMIKFLTSQEVSGYNHKLANSLLPQIDITGFLAQCQAIQLQQVKKEMLLDQFRVDAAIAILQAIHTQTRRMGLKEELRDFAQEIIAGKKSPEEIMRYLMNDLSITHSLTDKVRTLHESYLKNEKLFQSAKAEEKAPEINKAEEKTPEIKVEETKHETKKASATSSMWKKQEDHVLSQLESKCDELLNSKSKALDWIGSVKKLHKEYEIFVNDHKNKGLDYRLNNLGRLINDANKKAQILERQSQAQGKKNPK